MRVGSSHPGPEVRERLTLTRGNLRDGVRLRKKLQPSGCGRYCATLSNLTSCPVQPTTRTVPIFAVCYRGLTRRVIISVFMSTPEFRHSTPSGFIERRVLFMPARGATECHSSGLSTESRSMHLTRANQSFDRTELTEREGIDVPTEYEKIGFYLYWRLDIISSSSVLGICLCWRRVRSTGDFGRVGRSLCPTLCPPDAVNLFLAR